jgi:hypothetical protein
MRIPVVQHGALVSSVIVSLKNMKVVVDLKVCAWKILSGRMGFVSLSWCSLDVCWVYPNFLKCSQA